MLVRCFWHFCYVNPIPYSLVNLLHQVFIARAINVMSHISYKFSQGQFFIAGNAVELQPVLG